MGGLENYDIWKGRSPEDEPRFEIDEGSCPYCDEPLDSFGDCYNPLCEGEEPDYGECPVCGISLEDEDHCSYCGWYEKGDENEHI